MRVERSPPGVRHDPPRLAGKAAGEQPPELRRRYGASADDVDRAGVERDELLAAERDAQRLRRRRQVPLDEHVVVADRRMPGRVEPRRHERPLCSGEDAGTARRIDVGPVVERVGVARALDALVGARAAAGVDAAAVQHGDRCLQLVHLRVVDEVAGDDDGLRRERVQRPHGRQQHVRRERLLRPERGRERGPEPVEELHARRRLLVDDVGIGDLREDGELVADLRRRRELGPVEQRLAGPRSRKPSPSRSTNVASSVDDERGEGPEPKQPISRKASNGRAAARRIRNARARARSRRRREAVSRCGG